jgi:hypothetical protein
MGSPLQFLKVSAAPVGVAGSQWQNRFGACLFFLLFLLPCPSFADGVNVLTRPVPLLGCDNANVTAGDENIPWMVNSADSTICLQSVIGLSIDGHPFGKMVVALKNGVVVGYRRTGEELNDNIEDGRLFRPGDWLEHGNIGAPGELWWGRLPPAVPGKTPAAHVIVGQETWRRQQFQTVTSLDSMQYRLGQPLRAPFPPGRTIRYRQIAATAVTHFGYLGGSGWIPEGRADDAVLTLSPEQNLSGLLQVTLSVEGSRHALSFPVRNDVLSDDGFPGPEEINRASLAMLDSAGEPVLCTVENKGHVQSDCVREKWPSGTSGSRYSGHLYFFGDRSQYVAVHYHVNLEWQGESGHRGSGQSSGVLILQAQGSDDPAPVTSAPTTGHPESKPAETSTTPDRQAAVAVLSTGKLPACLTTVNHRQTYPRWLIRNNCGKPVEVLWCWSASFPKWTNESNICSQTGFQSSGLINLGAVYELANRPFLDNEMKPAAMLSVQRACAVAHAGDCAGVGLR